MHLHAFAMHLLHTHAASCHSKPEQPYHNHHLSYEDMPLKVIFKGCWIFFSQLLIKFPSMLEN